MNKKKISHRKDRHKGKQELYKQLHIIEEEVPIIKPKNSKQ